MATTVQTDEGRTLCNEPVVDSDRTTTRAGQPRPDFADHYDVRLRGLRVKGGDLDVLSATANASELYFRCNGHIAVVTVRSPQL